MSLHQTTYTHLCTPLSHAPHIVLSRYNQQKHRRIVKNNNSNIEDIMIIIMYKLHPIELVLLLIKST